MLSKKTGASIISLALCLVAVTLVTTALVMANNNSAMYEAGQIAKSRPQIVDSSAYVKVYTLEETRQIARQAYVDNYLALYENKVDLVGFEALVLGEVAGKIGFEQLENYNVYVTINDITVEYK